MGDKLIEVVGLENSILITDIWFILLFSDMGDKLIEIVIVENSILIAILISQLISSLLFYFQTWETS